MGKHFKFADKSGEKTIQAFLLEKRLEKQQSKTLSKLELTKRQRQRDIEAEIHDVKVELSTLNRGMTRLDSYFEKETNNKHKNTIWFPLVRSHEDWQPKPCWIGESAVNKERCLHFPCRTMTSYHFIFRQLPGWILEQAEESVRNSKEPDVTSVKSWQTSTDLPRETTDLGNMFPPIEFPEEMTCKERKLKMIIRKKRIQNEIENKPADRSINYGTPTPVRRLQRPVRPVMRKMDIH